ncbi:GIN domain-containing protein [Sphingomonas sp. MMS12-HWE2-04]|uniref:GIN domain-containing protein n=1 Tax=Sphingomonas sp. MMS12-HWE2-04 TaxID=3234199 RepID=UPI0038514F46
MRMLLIAATLPLAACQSNWEKGETAPASGSGASRSYTATGFTSVDLRGSDDVDVKIGNAFSVSAEGDPKALDELDIRVYDGALRVGRKQGSSGSDQGARVHVVLPKLTSASTSGSGDLDLSGIQGDALDLAIAGSGSIKAAGTIAKLDASIAGSGDIDATGLPASSADISIAGSGNLTGVVKGAASVSLVGSGDVTLTGGAKCSVSSVGSGDANCS